MGLPFRGSLMHAAFDRIVMTLLRPNVTPSDAMCAPNVILRFLAVSLFVFAPGSLEDGRCFEKRSV